MHAALFVIAMIASGVPGQTPAAGPPAWFAAEMTRLHADGARWTADNATYRTDQEPFDQYVVQWDWGPGRQSLRGRLFAVRAGADTPTMWEYRLFWHPGRREVRLVQHGSNGVVGEGVLTREADGSTLVVQDFFAPDGRTWRDRHIETMDGADRVSRSATWTGSSWQDRRSYRWTPVR